MLTNKHIVKYQPISSRKVWLELLSEDCNQRGLIKINQMCILRTFYLKRDWAIITCRLTLICRKEATDKKLIISHCGEKLL